MVRTSRGERTPRPSSSPTAFLISTVRLASQGLHFSRLPAPTHIFSGLGTAASLHLATAAGLGMLEAYVHNAGIQATAVQSMSRR
eukprot:4912066-Alexandrium_andersonii.AAC.1